jgi:hypothetical protein
VENRRIWRLDTLIPGLLVAMFLCDAACRYVRVEYFTFRGDEGMLQFRSAWKLGPYEANRHYHNDQASGDLPMMANRPEYRVFREQSFTTDDEGFRNPNQPGGRAPSVLMVGASFMFGGGNSDEQTLPFQVEEISGCSTYNAGGLSVRSDLILRLAQNRGMRNGLVIVECLERSVGDPILPRRGLMPWLPYREDALALYQTIETRLTISPLKVAFRRLYTSLRNDRILPNTLKDNVAVRDLTNGQPMLFLVDLERPKRLVSIAQNIEAYTTIRDELKAAGFDLALFIVPEKLTVYRSLLREQLPNDGQSVARVAELERSARARNIPILNLTPILTAGASEALEHGETVYWVDDTHWNPKGIEIAARAICDAFDLRARCESGK